MPVSRFDLLEAFGAAADVGNAVVFVGAGLSLDAGMPGWADLLDEPRLDAGIPEMDDLPLLAEYVVQSVRWPLQRLHAHILQAIAASDPKPTVNHALLAQLPVRETWTTNYDTLLEQGRDELHLIATDEDVRLAGTNRPSLVKMHGTVAAAGPARWVVEPVITRTDYETYEQKHQRMSALLRATYLSRTILFLGFSFTDPNVDLLLRLARTHQTAVSDRHMTVMRRPSSRRVNERRLFDLKVRDLESSGVKVHVVDEYGDHTPLLQSLVRRTRIRRLFVSGSLGDLDAGAEQDRFRDLCERMGAELADETTWELSSLQGDAGWGMSRAIARVRRSEGTYDAKRIVMNFRGTSTPPPTLPERLGTAVYTSSTREELVQDLLADSRALLAIHGATRTAEEISWAEALGIGIVPLACSGGSARDYWLHHRASPPDLGGRATDVDMWSRLDDDDPTVATRAAGDLIRQAMFERPTSR